jgi:hypothetical protein
MVKPWSDESFVESVSFLFELSFESVEFAYEAYRAIGLAVLCDLSV